MFFTRGTAKPAKPARQRVHDPRYPIRIRHTDVRPEYGWVLTPRGKAYAIALDCLTRLERDARSEGASCQTSQVR